MGLADALFLGLVATIASGLFVRRGSVTDCSPNPCVRYSAWGRPVEWRTNTPGHLIEFTDMDEGLFPYNHDGFSPGRFAIDVVLLSAPGAAVEALAFTGLWMYMWLRLVETAERP